MISSRGMARKAFLLGGTGQSGAAVTQRLAEAGWEVTAASRGNRPVPEEVGNAARVVQLDRDDTDAVRAALGDGVDVIVDFIAFERTHAEQLVALADHARSFIVLSSGSVYTDSAGRTFD